MSTAAPTIPVRRVASAPVTEPVAPRRLRAVVVATPRCRLGFFLFLLVNATLFIRPAEIFAPLEAWPIYNYVIIAALLASLPVVLPELSFKSLSERPWTLCVVLMLPAVVLSNLWQGDLWQARVGGIEFLKVVVYYLLLVGLVSTPTRLRRFLAAVAVMILVINVLAILRYHGLLDVLNIKAFEDNRGGFDEFTGENIYFERLMATGIFSDPNDMSLALVAATLIDIQFLLRAKRWLTRLWYALAMSACLYGLVLTYSRGGFLALVAGLGVLMVLRYGWKKAVILGVLLLPVVFFLFGGRHTDINFGDENDTAHARVAIWAEGFQLFKSSPVLGIGWAMFWERLYIVAHNSFVHSFVELGFVGGTLFVGCFYLPAVNIYNLGRGDHSRVAPELMSWRAGLLAVLVSYAVGLCSLSRSYTVSTYLILGLAGTYCNMIAAGAPWAAPPLSPRLIGRVVGVGFVALVGLYAFVKVVV